MSLVTRVTMFKIPKEEDRAAMIENYKELKAANSKDGKPYIVSLEAGPLEEDARSQGFTFVSKTVFASKEDFWYYDGECSAHKALKVKAAKLGIEGMMMVYFTPTVVGGL